MYDEDDEIGSYVVVVNDEEQFSIWRDGTPPPAGWRQVGTAGSRRECLEYVERVWTDMRPASLRARIAATPG
ncbi:MbtH family protein [Micromonospora sp. NPDC050417]|uniref:MbtH family protein n=1 Tax=Micromonospora sp. NPDC050417 TaxID=3364280 RepID=UPI00378F2D68